MAHINTLPIELKLSVFLAGLTSFLVEQRNHENIASSIDWNDDLLNGFAAGTVVNGYGIVHQFEKQIGTLETLTKTSTLGTLREPQYITEAITIDTYEFTATSLNEIVAPESFVNGTVMSEVLSVLYARNQKTFYITLVQKLLALYNNYTPTQTTQTVEVEIIDVTKVTDAIDKEAAERYNASAIANKSKKIGDDFTVYSNKYTDNKDAYTMTGRDTMQVILNKKWTNDWTTNALVTVFNANTLKEALPNGIELPESVVTNPLLIATFTQKGKFQYVMGYQTGASWFDASTLYTTFYNHRSLGMGIIDAIPAVQLVAKLV